MLNEGVEASVMFDATVKMKIKCVLLDGYGGKWSL